MNTKTFLDAVARNGREELRRRLGQVASVPGLEEAEIASDEAINFLAELGYIPTLLGDELEAALVTAQSLIEIGLMVAAHERLIAEKKQEQGPHRVKWLQVLSDGTTQDVGNEDPSMLPMGHYIVNFLSGERPTWHGPFRNISDAQSAMAMTGWHAGDAIVTLNPQNLIKHDEVKWDDGNEIHHVSIDKLPRGWYPVHIRSGIFNGGYDDALDAAKFGPASDYRVVYVG